MGVTFPITTVHKLTREVSDHSPIIIDTMEGKENQRREFRFEKRWLKEEDFLHRVDRIWAQPVRARDSLARFQEKLKLVKKNWKDGELISEGETSRKRKNLHKNCLN
jgi:hypothetical protein